jgi:hypothetical protein
LVGELVGELVGGQGSGEHDGDPLDVGDEVGVVGAEEVGSLVGALEVGADDFVWRVVGGGGGGVYGAWPVSGGFPETFAGGGNFSTGRPSRSAFITADQVAVG